MAPGPQALQEEERGRVSGGGRPASRAGTAPCPPWTGACAAHAAVLPCSGAGARHTPEAGGLAGPGGRRSLPGLGPETQHLPSQDPQEDVPSTPARLQSRQAMREPWPPRTEMPREAGAHGQHHGHDRDTEPRGSHPACGLLRPSPHSAPGSGRGGHQALGAPGTPPGGAHRPGGTSRTQPRACAGTGALTAQPTNLCPQ